MNRSVSKISSLLAKKNYRILISQTGPLSSTTNVPSIHDVRRGLEKLVAFDPSFGDSIAKSLKQTITSQKELKKEPMSASYAEAIIPLGDRPELRNKYSNFQKQVRYGRLLEDLDTMAVHISYLHNKSQFLIENDREVSPIVIVTGSVDQIHILNNSTVYNKNIKLSGFTSWVGRTSCEVSMKLEQQIVDDWVPILEAKFVMCARGVNNKGPGIMNPLEIITEKERTIYEAGNMNKISRLEELKTALTIKPPNQTESLAIHEMFKSTIDLKSGSLKIRHKPENTVWMQDTKLKNVIICHPEQRNLYNKIFGGFLMRQAYELAWTNASIYSKTYPRIKRIEDISFKKPVLIGSLLFLNSQVVSTDAKSMQIKVLAQAVNPLTNESEITNDFNFKFAVPDEINLPQVMPKTYSEYMLNIEGKRLM